MRKEIELDQLQSLIEDLVDCEALELCHFPEKEPDTLYIPYMMNDALEYYLVLLGCGITGDMTYNRQDATLDAGKREIMEGFSAATRIDTISDPDRKGLVFHMEKDGREAVFVIWFDRCQLVSGYYQYHRIGHFWKKGHEHLRQLVYIVGTVFDKFTFIGEEAVNEEERYLLPLITYAPFRYWSPVREDLESYYPNSLLGIARMKEFCQRAGDRSYYRAVCLYECFYRLKAIHKLPFIPVRLLDRYLASLLTSPKRADLYHLLYDRISSASQFYQERDYGPEGNAFIQAKRQEVDKVLISKGFEGFYPLYSREKDKKEYETLIAMEEHPFTFAGLDYEGFDFRIQCMYSKVPEKALGRNVKKECKKLDQRDCREESHKDLWKEEKNYNLGFFDGKAFVGRILDVEEIRQLL